MLGSESKNSDPIINMIVGVTMFVLVGLILTAGVYIFITTPAQAPAPIETTTLRHIYPGQALGPSGLSNEWVHSANASAMLYAVCNQERGEKIDLKLGGKTNSTEQLCGEPWKIPDLVAALKELEKMLDKMDEASHFLIKIWKSTLPGW